MGLLLSGCHAPPGHVDPWSAATGVVGSDLVELQIEHAALGDMSHERMIASLAPRTLSDETPPEYWDLTLNEAVELALANSEVFRDLGGRIIQSPSVARTVFEPAIRETDPRFGVQAALSEFDADFATSAFFEKNDRALNNTFFGGGTRIFVQDYHLYKSELTKRAATGSQFILRHTTDYDANNAPGNAFPSAWNTAIEAEARQPLLRGAGVHINRVAGPDATVGTPRGVLIARVDTDISLAQFELGVRNLVSDVENAYWDLFFGYRNLQGKLTARDSALETWRRIRALFETGRRGGEAEKEAQARDQYFFFRAEVENALAGRLLEGTRTNNGTSGGTFRGVGGVYVAERRLRLAMGLPPTDGRLIRTADEPSMARMVLDWDTVAATALSRRVELRQQRWLIKRRELELFAAKNQLKPQLDAVARYRWRGFGKDLLDSSGNKPRFDNAYANLLNGDYQEWQVGLELAVPLGFRQAHAGVRNAQLMLTRERAVHHELELQIIHDLSDAIGEMDRAYRVSMTNFNRREASAQQLKAVESAFEADNASLDLLLDAQRRLADAEAEYYRSLVEHAVAIKNVHFEQGALLEFNEIYLSEGAWHKDAYDDAMQRISLRAGVAPLSYVLRRPPHVSGGAYPQQRLHTHPEMIYEQPFDEILPPGATEPAVPGEELPTPAPQLDTETAFDSPPLSASGDAGVPRAPAPLTGETLTFDAPVSPAVAQEVLPAPNDVQQALHNALRRGSGRPPLSASSDAGVLDDEAPQQHAEQLRLRRRAPSSSVLQSLR